IAEGGALAAMLPVALAFPATLLNPYGVGLWTFLWGTLGPRPDIAEWQAVSLGTAEGGAYLAVLLFGAIGLASMWQSRRWVALVLFAAGAMLPFLARRHLPLFMLITIVMCAEYTAEAIGSLVRRRWPGGAHASSDRFRPVVAMALLLPAMVLLGLAVPQLTRIRVNAAEYPIAATAWLARSGVAANVA